MQWCRRRLPAPPLLRACGGESPFTEKNFAAALSTQCNALHTSAADDSQPPPSTRSATSISTRSSSSSRMGSRGGSSSPSPSSAQHQETKGAHASLSSSSSSRTPPSSAPSSLSPTAQLLSMNQMQRLLRRLPVAASSHLFSYNELPANIQRRVPYAAMEQINEYHRQWRRQEKRGEEEREERSEDEKGDCTPGVVAATQDAATAATARTALEKSENRKEGVTKEVALDRQGGRPQASPSRPSKHERSFDAETVLRLDEPLLTPWPPTLFALYRRAQKERQAVDSARRSSLQRDSWQQLAHVAVSSGSSNGSLTTTTPTARAPSSSDYLSQLEEPCLLVPDNRTSAVSLGLTTRRPREEPPAEAPNNVTASSSSGLRSRLDDFYLGLAARRTDCNVDYSLLPQHYVLGVPTALLDMVRDGYGDAYTVGKAAVPAASLRSKTAATARSKHDEKERKRAGVRCPARSPVDLSRWVVYDEVSAQFLLRRHGVSGPSVPSDSTDGSGPSYRSAQSVLEAQVFLAHAYSFDPKAAYDAAVALHAQQRRLSLHSGGAANTRSPSSTSSLSSCCQDGLACSYTLFYFHSAALEGPPFFALAGNAASLYPTCFYSYTTEVPTVAELAAEVAHRTRSSFGLGSSNSSARLPAPVCHGLADTPSPYPSAPFFIPLSGKRFRPRPRAGGDGGSGSAPASAWTAQTDGLQRHGGPSSSRSGSEAVGPRRRDASPANAAASARPDSAEAFAPSDSVWRNSGAAVTEKGGSSVRSSPGNVLRQLSDGFLEWQGIVSARALNCAAAAATATPHATVAHESRHARGGTAGGGGEHHPSAGRAALRSERSGQEQVARAVEDALDTETLALLQEPARAAPQQSDDADGTLGRMASAADQGSANYSLVESWRRGWRFAAAPIAVAVPVVYDATMSLTDSISAAPAASALFADGGAPASSGSQLNGTVTVRNSQDVRGGRAVVTDAPLAEAVWRAVYLPTGAEAGHVDAAQTQQASRHVSGAAPWTAATTAAVTMATAVERRPAVLPLAPDRLGRARQRVLLPFLRTPRSILPATHSEPRYDSDVDSAHKGDASDTHHHHHHHHHCDVDATAAEVCPVLWHLDELESVCGWRRYRSQLAQPLGSFSALLTPELYVSLGGGRRCGLEGWRSPVVLVNDDEYVRQVLVPALCTFEEQRCTWSAPPLYVYKGLYHDGEDEGGASASTPPPPPSSSLPLPEGKATVPGAARTKTGEKTRIADVETAVAVGVHHRHVLQALLQLQSEPSALLREWLAADPHDATVDLEMSRRTGLAELHLSFFRGQAMARAAASLGSAAPQLLAPPPAAAAAAAAEQCVEERVSALRSLLPEGLAVVPVLDFLAWASLCSDATPAAQEAMRRRGPAIRQHFTAADCVMFIKYCLQFPSEVCVEGGNGTTVAVMRSL